MSEHIKNFGKNMPFPSFSSFNAFEVFKSDGWFSDHFGSFTFEMAEEVFEKAFKNVEQEYMDPHLGSAK